MPGRISSVSVFRYYVGLYDLFSYPCFSHAKEKGFLYAKILSGQVANISCWSWDQFGDYCSPLLSPREPEKLEIGRFLGTVWAEPGKVTPSLDNLRIRGPESGDQPVYAFLHPDSLLNNERGGKSPKKRPSCKPRPPKKPRGQGKAR